MLVDLLDDLNAAVHASAACALGRMGQAAALPVLMRLLQKMATIEVVEAAAMVADGDIIVLLGRLARSRRDLADTVLDALDACEDTLAARVASGLRAER